MASLRSQAMGLVKKVGDTLAGRSYVDNTTNPASAVSINRRKNAMRPSPSARQNPVGRDSNGVGVGM